MSWLTPCPAELLFTKNDPQDPRWGEKVDLVRTESLNWMQDLQKYCVLGFPDEEGIQLNKGRGGAEKGPQGIRHFLYRMTPSPFLPLDFKISDLGNLKSELTLEERHERARSLVYNLAKHDKHWVSLGGGHDYGYCDSAGFVEAFHGQGPKPIVLNFDAHLDVRKTDQGLNSGTPFYRLLEQWSDQCLFFEIGIQGQCNSRHHYQYVLDHGGHVIPIDDIKEQGLTHILSQLLANYPNNPCFVSMDIDVFSSAEAPGCSQSWPWGLTASEFFPSFRWLLQNLNVRGLGIYEVAPALDVNSNTQRLAALIAYEFLSQAALKNKTGKKI